MKSWPVIFIATAPLLSRIQFGEIERNFGCEIETTESIAALQNATKSFHLAVLEITPENREQCLSVLQSLPEPRPYEQLIVIQKMPIAESVDDFLQFGMIAFVPIGTSMDAIYEILDRHFSTQSQLRSLDNQLREASDIAILSMSASSQLGEIIRFLEYSYRCRNYDELGELLNETLERLGVAGCGLIEFDNDFIYFGAEDKKTAWKRLMLELRDKGRFIDIENRTITNFDSISVMARNLPEVGSEPYGRMKDMLFTLVEGADERVKTLALEQAVTLSERAKSSFLRIMSHELRTPMNAILGFSHRLAARTDDAPMTPREMSALGMINDNANRLMEMIADLEDLSNIRVDSVNARSRVLVEDVLMDVLRTTKAKAQEKGLQFKTCFAEAGLQAELDPARLTQVMKKICSNAVKYTEQGAISVNVSSHFDRKIGEQLVISVQDTGPGMPPQRAEELFKRYAFQQDYIHHHQGTGLGLTVVREFVADMQGCIDLDTSPEKGTCITLKVPQFISHGTADEVELFS